MNDHIPTETSIGLYLSKREKRIIEIVTESGKKLRLSEDHPILTPDGMKEAKYVEKDDKVAVYHFDGVEFEEKTGVIISENSIPQPYRKILKSKGLLPFTYTHPLLGVVARLFGYILGDGTVYLERSKRKRWIVRIYSKNEMDLKEIRKEIKKLGFKPSRVYERKRRIKGRNSYGEFETVTIEKHIKISSSSFAQFLIALGMPYGKRTAQPLRVPIWIKSAPKWVKRNFLAGLFGAELTKPSTIKKHPYTFSQPMLTIGVRKDLKEDGKKFLEEVANLLREFNVKVTTIYETKGTDKTIGLRLVISNKDDNLINLWSQISYEYNFERKFLASVAVAYLRKKKKFKRNLKDRVQPYGLETFQQFVQKAITDGKLAGFVFERIIKKKTLEFNDFVYDFTVLHKDHNFIANGFIVHNCGVRLLRTNLEENDVRPKLKELLETIFRNVPSGVGRGGKVKLSREQVYEVLKYGAKWAVEHGYGWEKDLEHIEDKGNEEKYADPSKVSEKAMRRGMPQLGSLGAGNHFLEIQIVDKIFLPDAAKVFGITNPGQVTVMIHTGSRGLGHQVATDYLRLIEREHRELLNKLPDRELAFAPSGTKLFEDYFAAMNAAANFAFANRQMITHWVRQSFEEVFGKSAEDLGLELIYGITHNMAKLEEHKVDGKKMKVLVHRKGATRAFGPSWEDVPKDYKSVGQPVLIPGSMGSVSYVLIGTDKAEEVTFSSIAHGAGRVKSRARALREYRGERVSKELERRGILVRAASWKVVAEEAPGVYKDVDEVVKVCEKAGIARIVARLIPIGVVKG
ncbi:MAG: RtcB family protein [Candidatus Aenigmarchaeota archaeon]|nr:RtcB family protein [Candidatus Aenigmarchaeota archaeon]